MAYDEQLATLQQMIVLAAIDMVRASKRDIHAEVDPLIAQVLETADSPEHAVEICIAVFAGYIDIMMNQLGRDAEDLLQGTLLSDLKSDDD